MEARLSLITLACKNVKQAGDFYLSLGWEETQFTKEIPNMYFFPMVNGILLGLYAQENLEDDVNIGSLSGQSSTLAWNARSQEEQDEMIDLWEKNGGTIIRQAFDTPWGGRVAYVRDTEGHIWEITYIKDFPIDKKGNLSIT